MNGQYNSCYYFKSEIAAHYYNNNISDTTFYYLDQLTKEYGCLTKADFFKMAVTKQRLNHPDYKTHLLNYFRSGGEMSFVSTHEDLYNEAGFGMDSLEYIMIIDSVRTDDKNNVPLNKFLEALETAIKLSNYVRSNDKMELFYIVDSVAFMILNDFFTDSTFMSRLKPTPALMNKSNELLAILIHSNYYSESMSDMNNKICLALLDKNIIRPKDYWYIHYRRLEVLDKANSKGFEKGNLNEIESFRLKIGMLLEGTIWKNVELLGHIICENN